MRREDREGREYPTGVFGRVKRKLKVQVTFKGQGPKILLLSSMICKDTQVK